jgi:hypothetical protein
MALFNKLILFYPPGNADIAQNQVLFHANFRPFQKTDQRLDKVKFRVL